MYEKVLHINTARYIKSYMIEVEFDDGVRKTVDVEPLLTGVMFEPLKNKSTFSNLTIDPVSRTIMWPNGADLAPEALYELPPVEIIPPPE